MSIEIDFAHSNCFAWVFAGYINHMKLGEFFEKVFAWYDDSKTVCTLRFISPGQMKKHEPKIDYSTRDTCINLIDDFCKRMRDRERCTCLSNIFSHLEKLKEALLNDKNIQDKHSAGEAQWFIKLLQEVLDEFKRCERDCYENREVLIREIDKIMEELYLLQFPMTLFGCYYRKYGRTENVIFICLENIEDEWASEVMNKSSMRFRDYEALLFSIIVHEYAHFVDANTSKHKVPRRGRDRIFYSALKETIAETAQKIYIDERIEPLYNTGALPNWIDKHSASGNFPGWGYAGAKILSEEGTHNLKDLLVKLIDISREDWQAGYHFINSIRILKDM